MDLKSMAVAKWPESSPALFNTVATTTTSAFRSSISRSGRNSVDSPYTTVAPERTRKQLLFSFLFFLPLVGGPASGYGIKLAEAKHCLESIMACCKWQSRTYSIRNSSGDDRLDDDARTSSTDDAESQSGSVVDKVDHLHLGPFRVELSWRQEEKKRNRLQDEKEDENTSDWAYPLSLKKKENVSLPTKRVRKG